MDVGIREEAGSRRRLQAPGLVGLPALGIPRLNPTSQVLEPDRWRLDPTGTWYTLPSGCITMKTRRQALILQLLDREPIHNQEQLRRGSTRSGVHATQATISRDIKELGLLKRASDGAYQRASAPMPCRHRCRPRPSRGRSPARSRRPTACSSSWCSRRRPGRPTRPPSPSTARCCREVVGTIAGDDTILVILRDPRRAAAFGPRSRHHRQIGRNPNGGHGSGCRVPRARCWFLVPVRVRRRTGSRRKRNGRYLRNGNLGLEPGTPGPERGTQEPGTGNRP